LAASTIRIDARRRCSKGPGTEDTKSCPFDFPEFVEFFVLFVFFFMGGHRIFALRGPDFSASGYLELLLSRHHQTLVLSVFCPDSYLTANGLTYTDR
jgi:hypothetical protein